MQENEYRDNFVDAVRLSRLPGVGAHHFAELVRLHGSPRAAMHAWSQVTPPDSLKAPLAGAIGGLERYFAEGGQGVYLGAEDYPALLDRISEPPPYLFRRGPLWPLDSFSVAIVGAREASEAALSFARDLANALAGIGVTVVSGGALGVDAAAHEGSLSAGNRAVLVSATGIDRVYPASNQDLFDRVAEHGCILTELLPGTPPRKDFFPTRNRIVVGLARLLIVVEGKLQSGSASSYHHMRRLGRLVFAWTGASGAGAELPALILSQGGLPLSAPDPLPILHYLLRPLDSPA